ncbi:hypothetical protein MMC18_003577 [Xylographa bjoerkii]|nr:hypothetical protein [Xylographa bjoerkii]
MSGPNWPNPGKKAWLNGNPDYKLGDGLEAKKREWMDPNTGRISNTDHLEKDIRKAVDKQLNKQFGQKNGSGGAQQGGGSKTGGK